MTLTLREVGQRALPGGSLPLIVVIDDDHLVCDSLAATLSVEGFDVVTATTAEEGLALVAAGPPALVILDTQIGDSDGFAVFRRISDLVPSVPVIMVTMEDHPVDAALALDAGAADHVTKPLRPRELTARIRAVLRRIECLPPAPTGQGATHTLGPITVDMARREALFDGCEVELSRKEFDLLALLTAAGGHVVTRAQCMERIWGDRTKGDSRTLDTHVKRLRKKIEVDPAEPVHLLTVRGVGYRVKP
jgi:DNA-binding response OmpR family regulator